MGYGPPYKLKMVRGRMQGQGRSLCFGGFGLMWEEVGGGSELATEVSLLGRLVGRGMREGTDLRQGVSE